MFTRAALELAAGELLLVAGAGLEAEFAPAGAAVLAAGGDAWGDSGGEAGGDAGGDAGAVLPAGATALLTGADTGCRNVGSGTGATSDDAGAAGVGAGPVGAGDNSGSAATEVGVFGDAAFVVMAAPVTSVNETAGNKTPGASVMGTAHVPRLFVRSKPEEEAASVK